LTAFTCRECGRSAAETGAPVFVGAVAFTCSSCLLTGSDSLPTCRRCLGPHWDARCDYNAAEAQAAFSTREAAREGQHSAPTSAAREIGSVAKSRFVSAVAISSTSGAPRIKRHAVVPRAWTPISKRARGYLMDGAGADAARPSRLRD
jgi:hypothetical protein